MTPPPTPMPPTPSVKVGPTRFEFEDLPPSSIQEESVPPLKDHIIEALKKRIFELENESRDLKLYADTFKKLFRPDSILKATGQRKKVNWSNETMEQSLHDKVVLGSTGYDHLQSKFPGMYPSKTTQNKTLRENMNVPFGIIEDSFKLLEITAKKKHAKQKYISLIMDEMAIKELVEYDPSLKCLTGAITMPLGDDATIDDGKINPISIPYLNPIAILVFFAIYFRYSKFSNHSAHQTINFTYHEFRFSEFKVLQSVFDRDFTSWS